MQYITKNFTLEELYRSTSAIKNKIDNTPDKECTKNLMLLAYKVLQPIRDVYNNPIRVSSGFRCPELNKVVGGVKTSQHLKGEASDLNNGVKENKKIFDIACRLIKEGKIEVGQLIDEKNYSWIHISLPDKNHKNQILHL